jgi:hypothetical protein
MAIRRPQLRWPKTHWPKPHWSAWLFVAIVAVAVGIVIVNRDDESEPAPLDIQATSIYQFSSLDEMVAASDAIVVGRVTATERGRLIGDPADGGVISRLVTITVTDVLAGVVGTTLIVEEEGWLTDGTSITVNGVAPSQAGDEGVWFLDLTDDAELPAFLVINSQGRFLVADDGTLRGGDQRDVLVQQLQRHSLTQLVTATEASVLIVR